MFGTWLRTGRSCGEPLPGAHRRSRSGRCCCTPPRAAASARRTGPRPPSTCSPLRLARPVTPSSRCAAVPCSPPAPAAAPSACRSRRSASRAQRRTAVAAIAGPEALGAASDGLILRDTIYAATGVPVPSLLDDRTGRVDLVGPRHADRAGLGGGHRHLRPPVPGPRPTLRWDWGPTGALVVNSVSPTTSCRTLISQVQLPGDGTLGVLARPARARRAPTWSSAPASCARSLPRCSTARFPYVTPSGVVDCPGPDGILRERRRRRDPGRRRRVRREHRRRHAARPDAAGPRGRAPPQRCVLAADPRAGSCRGEPATDTLVVPPLVYFDNGTGSDLVSSPRGVTLEALVPPITILQAKGALYSARAQLERATPCSPPTSSGRPRPSSGDAAGPAVDAWRGNQVAVVFQATRPGLAAPLGWVLSRGSITAMDAALCKQDPVKDLGFGAARDLTSPVEDSPDGVTVEPPTRFGTIDDVLGCCRADRDRCARRERHPTWMTCWPARPRASTPATAPGSRASTGGSRWVTCPTCPANVTSTRWSTSGTCSRCPTRRRTLGAVDMESKALAHAAPSTLTCRCPRP